MSDIDPATPQADNLPAPADGQDSPPPATPERKSFGSLLFGILNFLTLSARFAALSAAAMFLKENLHLLKARMERNSGEAIRIAELCGAADVDPYHLSLVMEASTSLLRVAEASGEAANAVDDMEANARGVGEAHEAEYRGTYEVRQASPYQQPKPCFTPAR